MKRKSRLFALAVVCVGIPAATLVAQPPANRLAGTWQLTVSGQHMPGPLSAISICNRDGSITEIGYQRFPGVLGIGAGTHPDVGYGNYVQTGAREFRLTIQTELPDHRSQRVSGIAFLSESGDQVTGSAETQILSQNGTVLYSTHVDVVGKRVPRLSRLTAMR
jgi:hypothetical protein